MQTVDVTELTRPLEIERKPATKWDSTQAVLYRVGERVNPFDVKGRFTDAEEEALAERFLPRLGNSRRRYLAAVAVEEPRDLALPMHKRPALLRAFALAPLLTGGLLVERAEDLGNAQEAEVVLFIASFFAGRHPHLRAIDDLEDVPGTVTVGHLGESGGKRQVSKFEFRTVADATVRMRRDFSRIAEQMSSSPLGEAATGLVSAALHAHEQADEGLIRFTEFAKSSELFADLTVRGAAEYVSMLRAQRASVDRILQSLLLFGFVNPAGHRTWSKAHLAALEGRRR